MIVPKGEEYLKERSEDGVTEIQKRKRSGLPSWNNRNLPSNKILLR
jgi:hypothetical protein